MTDIKMQQVVLIHNENAALIEGKTRDLAHKAEVLFNLSIKAEPYHRPTNLYRWGGFITRIILGLLMIWMLFIVPVMVNVIYVQLSQPHPNLFLLLLAFICIPTSIYTTLAGVSLLIEACRLIFPKKSYIYSRYRDLQRKNQLFEGRITALRTITIEQVNDRIQGLEVDYQFINKTSTQFHGKYFAFEIPPLQIGDKILVLYYDPKIHIIL